MPLLTTVAFGATATIGGGLFILKWLNGRPKRQERIVIQVQQAFRAAGLGIKGAEWPVEKVIRITSGKRGEDGLLQGWKLTMRYPDGINLYDVQSQCDKISEWFGAQIKAQGIGGKLYLSIYDPRAAVVVPLTRTEWELCRDNWTVPVGLGEDGWVRHDFAKTPHMLVGGATDSGKTNFLTSLVYCLFRSHTFDECRFYVVDMKRGISFRFLQDSPYLAAITYGTAERHNDRLAEAEQLLGDLVAEMHHSYQRYEEWGVTDWREAEKRGKRITHRFLVVDECAELRGQGKEGKELHERIWSHIASLTQLGRAAAVHVVLATQRPEVDVVPGLVKANLDARLAFRLPDPSSSLTILGRGGAEHLPPIKGRALYLTDHLHLVQTPKIDMDSVRLRAAMTSRNKELQPAKVEYAEEWEGSA